MEIYPDFETALSYSREYKTIPVTARLIADMVTPVNLFLSVRQKNKNCFLLESAENEGAFGRYSIIGYNAETLISFKDGILKITKDGETNEKPTANPFGEINEIIKNNISPVMPGMPKFTGALTGYFGYDTVRFAEPTVKNCPPDGINAPDIQLMDCANIIVFDHLRQRVTLTTRISAEGDLKENYARAEAVLIEMRGEIYNLKTSQTESAAEKLSVKPLISREEFIENVKKAKDYIYNGDIFQVVLSQRFEISNPPDAFKVYRALRAEEPSPYMYTMCFEDCEIVGSSPEKLISVENGLVTSCPIAGTIKRGKSESEDKALESKLLSNEKERAEHIMLVDLARNDIGKICEFGTVNVDKLMQIGRFSKLMHIISQVTGNLKSEYSLTDVLASSLPAGTLSGAPKIRAMQIIDEIETQKRGLYGGSIGYMGFNGIMDMCIAIRTAFFSGGKAYVQAGAGIVADSVPEAEYEEVLTKTSAVLNAFEKAGELL
ncbi:MAG: anthranilate synthase component I [Clostridiales bacterium]|jgi:anthranilate synthase component 1|nr:anthranilate synthase component I [Clostridiales bacterium]